MNCSIRKRKRSEENADSLIENETAVKPVFNLVSEATNEKNCKLFDDQGFSYTKHMDYACGGVVKGSYWRCSRYHRFKCRSRVYQEYGTSNFKKLADHTHDFNFPYEKDKQSMSKEEVANKRNIIDSCLKNLTSTKCSATENNLETNNIVGSNPDLYPQLIMEEFSTSNEDLSFILTSKPYLDMLCESIYLKICCSTELLFSPFKTAIVFQTYGKSNDETIVKINLAYIFLSDLNNIILKESLQNFKSMLPHIIKEKYIVVHPDDSLWSEVQKIFPENELKFEPSQWRKIVDESIESCAVNRNLPIIKKVCCLNLLPAVDIAPAYILLRTEMKQYKNKLDYKNMKTFFKNMKVNWFCNDLWQPTNWTAYEGIYGDDSFVYDKKIKDRTSLLSQVNRDVADSGHLCVVTDLEIIKNISKDYSSKIKLHKFWQKYDRKKYKLEKFIEILSDVFM